jgi:uncharacterized protein with HEPN domain
MLSEKESGALRDMLRHIDLAEQFAHGHSYESLRDDLRALYAVIRSLEIISEASRRLSDELKARKCRDSLAGNRGSRQFYRHNYEDVTPRRVWKTLHEDLPPLRASVDQELKRG